MGGRRWGSLCAAPSASLPFCLTDTGNWKGQCTPELHRITRRHQALRGGPRKDGPVQRSTLGSQYVTFKPSADLQTTTTDTQA